MNEVRPIHTPAEQALAAAFKGAEKRLPGGAAFAQKRKAAFESFLKSGLPHRRIEEWKYTDLRTLLREAAPLAAPPDKAAIGRARMTDTLLGVAARRLTLVDGAFVPELSDLAGLEKNLTIVPLANALAEKHPLAERVGALVPAGHDAALALNTAFFGDGVLIEVGEGMSLKQPIHVRHIFAGTTPAATFTRTLVSVGRGAHATVVESFEGPDGLAYQANTALELKIGDGAEFHLVRLEAEGDASLHLSTLLIELNERAEVASFALTTGAAVSRQSLNVHFAGKVAKARLAGATLLRDRQHADTTLVLDHVLPGGESRALFKSVLDETSRGVVQGRIVVRPDAQKTDARMMLGALLLGEEAEADHKPELEIFADDVQCGHGATAGAIDETLMFYLMTRGIPRKDAEALLIESFFGEAIETVAHEGLRAALAARAHAWLLAREQAR